MTKKEEKLTKEELLEQMERCWHLYSLPEAKKNQQAYTQLKEIVEEHFYIKSMNLEEAQRWVEKDIQKMREQQKKVSREWIEDFVDDLATSEKPGDRAIERFKELGWGVVDE